MKKTIVLQKEYFSNVCDAQRNSMLEQFELNKNGDIVLTYSPKGYFVNNKKMSFNSGITAISMFSGAGGLDIGTQLAGVEVASSLDFFEDSVKTIEMNK